MNRPFSGDFSCKAFYTNPEFCAIILRYHKEKDETDMTDTTYRNETVFLDKILEKLKKRLSEVSQDIYEGQKDIENMHEYYWESYTEMDEYGYENFDNQQALFQQIHANEEKLLFRHRLKRMLDSPYFGRVDFLYAGDDEPERFYIGIGNFAERTGAVPLIYDWRAPVSGLFYDYDQGEASYEAPGGTMEGEITSKWQYKIRDGKMVYAFESDMKIDDEILQQELGSSGDVQLKNIVRTIQREQNAIIRNTKDRILVIQGAAGSGKTSVALHRIAYLLYHDRSTLKSSDILILSPNSVFSDYISHILPELGEEPIREMSFDLFAYRELREAVEDCEDRYNHIERMLSGMSREELLRFHRKQSEDFVGETEMFLALLEDELMNFRKLEFKGFEKTEQELIDLFYFKFQDHPLLARMDAVAEYVIDEYETLRDKTVSDEERQEILDKFYRMYETTDLYVLYNRLLENCGYPVLPDVPKEKRTLSYEDVFPMLYLKYRLWGKGARRNIRHLVVDEMQDYSYLQYTILKGLFDCKMTILGDWAQTMDGETQDVLQFLPRIFGKDIRKIVMKKSYRNTAEIASYACAITGVEDLELFERHGEPVAELSMKSLEEAVQMALEKLNSFRGHKETSAILAMTEGEAKEICRLLSRQSIPYSYIDRDSSSFCKGLTVTTFYLAKGLEFDQVACIYRKGGGTLLRQARYICATRALHELVMCEYEGQETEK